MSESAEPQGSSVSMLVVMTGNVKLQMTVASVESAVATYASCLREGAPFPVTTKSGTIRWTNPDRIMFIQESDFAVQESF